jgi:hypothetical protein
MCEKALVAAAKQGQAEAFGALCQPLARKLIQSAQRITRNREDAEDASSCWHHHAINLRHSHALSPVHSLCRYDFITKN